MYFVNFCIMFYPFNLVPIVLDIPNHMSTPVSLIYCHYIFIAYSDIMILYMVQIQSSKGCVFKSRFLFKVRQQQLNHQLRTLSFSTTLLNLQPPLKYPPLIPFFYAAVSHLTISPAHLLPKPSLQSLPTLPSSISTLYLFIQLLLLFLPKIISPTAIFQPIQAATKTQ